MKKVALGILAALATIVLGILGVAATRSDDFRCERSRTLPVAVRDVAPMLTDLRNWNRWSPWSALDPAMRLVYSEDPTGVGAFYTWEGNEAVGKGRMAISAVAEERGGTRVDYDLTFLEPFPSEADVTIAATPVGEGSRVTWTMRSKRGLMEKVFGLFVDMDAMLGRDFERGLANLERTAR